MIPGTDIIWAMDRRIVISIDSRLLRAVDADAKALGISRAAWVRLVSMEHLPRVVVPDQGPDGVEPGGPDIATPQEPPSHSGHKKTRKTNFNWCEDCKEVV